MKSFQIAVLAAFGSLVAALPSNISGRAVSSVVTGTPFGFASAVTGGGTTAPVYPKTIADLKKYLTSTSPQVIVISGTFDFAGSEGTEVHAACNQYSCTPENGGQSLLNTLGGCGTASTYSATIDVAAYQGINVASDKTLVGLGTNTVLNGKGLRMAGVSNIIIQNIKITNLNPKYVWGGDAISLSNTNNIWIDHVTTSNLGRQHYSLGQAPNLAVTISNSYVDGKTSHSATCDGHTYWGLELVGTNDAITFYKNYVSYTSGRSPALSGGTLFHAVNSVWASNSGHAIEGGTTKGGLFEGCSFVSVPTVLASGYAGSLLSATASNAATCTANLGRPCVANSFTNSGAFTNSDSSFFSAFKGKNIPAAASANSITSIVKNAGNTLA
ncbi:pectin lyase fold/virulence factor [Leptodontidium sp. 2 PMI_412]|nr:polysaccharide lyase family 1 protein [Leptodontidium sp. MPI-SDFR-AT-0119]KAH9206074.1 pectin lyase fold/virulence factor [Leptodontidium sp. 2 PMI_412]